MPQSIPWRYRQINDTDRLEWLLAHALGDIEVESVGRGTASRVVRSVRSREEIDRAMREEKPRAE